jgi:hypothetical protein
VSHVAQMHCGAAAHGLRQRWQGWHKTLSPWVGTGKGSAHFVSRETLSVKLRESFENGCARVGTPQHDRCCGACIVASWHRGMIGAAVGHVLWHCGLLRYNVWHDGCVAGETS